LKFRFKSKHPKGDQTNEKLHAYLRASNGVGFGNMLYLFIEKMGMLFEGRKNLQLARNIFKKAQYSMLGTTRDEWRP
jgi:hypothetical protein